MKVGSDDMNNDIEQILTEGLPFRWGAASDVGKVRAVNEDAYVIEPEVGLFVVSDGMGGHKGGALASSIVAEDLSVMIENRLHRLRSDSPRAVRRLFKAVIAEQSRQLWIEGAAGEHGYREMGATVVVLLIRRRRAYTANLGDSRIYRFRAGRLRQLTRDHSVISELLAAGDIEPHEVENHEAAGQITHYIGMEEDAEPHVRTFALQKGDRLMLCTDGLTDMLDEKSIAGILATEEVAQTACEKLVKKANNAGGHDNITTLIVDYTKS